MENNEIQQGKQKTKYRIGTVAVILLIVTAVIADLITLIPIAGDIVGPLYWIIVSVYLWKAGLGFVNGRRLAVEAISIVAELIPVVQELPAILAGVIAIIIMTRIEDRTGISLNPLKKKGVTPPRMSRQPLNSTPGVRPPRQSQEI
jgi:hypothetical protein